MRRQAELPPGQTASLKFPTVLGILSSGAIWQTAEWAGSKPRKDFTQTWSWPRTGSGAMECFSFTVCFSRPWKIPPFPFPPVASPLPQLRKKTNYKVKLCFLALPFTSGAWANQRHMGYISLERHSGSKANLAKDIGGGRVVLAHPEPLKCFSEILSSLTHLLSVWGALRSAHFKVRHCA